MAVVKLGIIGCGAHALGAHGPAAANIPHLAQFTACCDVRRENAEGWAARFGADHVYTDYQEMLRHEALDGVVFATWPNQHHEQVTRALALGAGHILCEKSLTLTGHEACVLFRVTREAGATLMEGFMYRHHPAIRAMQQILATGACGPVDAVRACFSAHDPETEDPQDSARNWRQRKECGGGIPYDFACYAVNACGCFTQGVPVRAFCVGGESAHFGTINRLYGMIEYDNGRVGIIESSKQATMSQELEVTGPLQSLYLPVAWTILGDAALTVKQAWPWPKPAEEAILIPGANAYQLQLENFAAVIRGDARPVVPLAQSVMSIYALEALVTSLQEHRMVGIDIPGDIIAEAREEIL